MTCRYCDPGSQPNVDTALGCTASAQIGPPCSACPEGLVSAKGKGCTECPAGRQANLAGTNCDACAPGKYRDGQEKTTQGRLCQQCKVQEPGTEPNADKTACVCKSGWYSYEQDPADIVAAIGRSMHVRNRSKTVMPYHGSICPECDGRCEVCCHPCPTEEEVGIALTCPGGVPASIHGDSNLAGMAVVFPGK